MDVAPVTRFVTIRRPIYTARMYMGRTAVRLAMGVALAVIGVTLAVAQPLPPPKPSGRQIQAAEGDDRVRLAVTVTLQFPAQP